jgi:hypothetical protein
VTGWFNGDSRLLDMGAQSQFNVSDVEAQMQQQIPLLYFFAFQAGALRSEEPNTGVNPTFTTDLNLQEAALANISPDRWIAVARAGETSIDLICARYQSALYELDRARRTTLANLTTIQSATVAIMGLALAAQKAIGIVGVAFGLAVSLFNTTVSSVLFQLPPASVVSVMNAQRNIIRSQETSVNADWVAIRDPVTVAKRLNEYIRYCTPVIIEANVGMLLGQTTFDSSGHLVAQTQPATGPPLVRQTFIPSDLRNRVFALQPETALIVARIMLAKLNERSPELQQNLRGMIPHGFKRLPKPRLSLNDG